ncbi:MAG: helix-turn-helix domain-containing protein [Anaerolineae bacterium]|nr:helix-turn-helix domain-containing protein [Anaerolineae bacterium]
MPAKVARGSSDSSVVKSAARAFEVLELFRTVRRQLTASEVGQALVYPKSSTNALMKSLVALGYLVVDRRTLRYFPSLSVTQLGDWVPSMLLASGNAIDILNDVHSATQETVTLTVQNDLHCRFLRVIPGTFPITLHISDGSLAPLFTTAVGISIAMQLPDEEINQLLERTNIRAKRRGDRLDPAKVAHEVREARQRGYTTVYEALLHDTGAVAAPLPSDVKGFPMAIGVGGLSDRIRRNEQSISKSIRSAIARGLGRSRRQRTWSGSAGM